MEHSRSVDQILSGVRFDAATQGRELTPEEEAACRRIASGESTADDEVARLIAAELPPQA